MHIKSKMVIMGLAALTLLPLAQAEATKQTITMWDNQVSRTAIEEICRLFKKKTGIHVETTWVSQADYKSLLLGHAVSGNLPDMVMVPADYLGNDRELAFSEIPASLKKGIVQNAAEIAYFEGRLLGVPTTWGNHLMLFYNRSIVATPATSFEELALQAPELKAKGSAPLAMSYNEMYWMVPFLGAFGAWPLDPSGSVALNNPPVVEALRFYNDLSRNGLTNKDCHHDCILEGFVKGEYAYAIGGDWMISEMEQKLGKNFGIAKLPTIGKRELRPMYSATLIAFPGKSLDGPKRRILLQFAQHLLGREAQTIWAQSKLFPVNEGVFRTFSMKAEPNMQASLVQLKTARAMPNDRAMAFAWAGMAKGFSALKRGKSAEDAAALMQSHAEKMMARDSQ